MAHSHRAVSDNAKVRPFNGPVKYPGNPSAHGNITVRDTCRCGAVRDCNVNGRHLEYGTWEVR